MKNKKICADCLFYNDDHYRFTCISPHVYGHKNIVTGEVSTYGAACSLQREDGWLGSRIQGTCGEAGRFFVSKHDHENPAS